MAKKRTAKRRNSTRKVGHKSATKPIAVQPLPSSAQVPARNSRYIFNRVEIAELMGVHPDTITDNTRLGMPVVTVGGHGKESEYDAVACLGWWRDRQGKNALQNAQTKLYEANAANSRTKLEQSLGKLVSRNEVEIAGYATVKALTAKLLSMPVKLRHLGFITREQEGGIAKFVRELLTDISAWKTVADAMNAATEETK